MKNSECRMWPTESAVVRIKEQGARNKVPGDKVTRCQGRTDDG